MLRQIAAVASLALLCAPAQADLILMLDDGNGNVETIADGDAADSSGLPGVVVFTGALGSFIVNVSTGISAPSLGSLVNPILDLNSVQLSSGGGTMTIGLTATGFLGPIGANNYLLAFGGTTDGSIQVDAYYDTSNTAWGQGSHISTLSDPGGAFGFDDFGGVDIGSSPYSLTLLVTVTHYFNPTAPMSVSSFDAYLRVPEPATLGIFGLGLLLLGMTRVRRPVNARN